MTLNKKEISKITIKTTSGYCPIDYVYEDKMIITNDSLSYVCRPRYLDSRFMPIKWSYKSNSSEYKSWFNDVVKTFENSVSNVSERIIFDVGEIKFTVLYEDGEKISYKYSFTNEFNDLLKQIKKMVPEVESKPMMLMRL